MMGDWKDLLLQIGVSGMKVLYAPLKLLPTGNKVVFISRQSDEPSIDIRLLQDFLAMHDPEIKTVALCRRLRTKPSYIGHVLRQMFHLATARCAVLDGYCISVSVLHHKKALRIIQMWHAMGSMKCFGYAMIGKEEGNRAEVARILKMHQNYDYVLISSLDFLKDYEEGFRMDPRIVKEIPLPRADILADREAMEKRRKDMVIRYPMLQGKKNILYCPTFRIGESGKRVPEKVRELIDRVDFSRYNFIYKPHPNSRMNIADDRVLTIHGYNVDALCVADYMISDYSSMIYEAGLAEVPVFFYAYDWEEYRKKRELNLDLERDIPALFTDDPEKIITAIENDIFDREAFHQFIQRNIRMPETSCCEELVKLIKGAESS